MPPDFAVHCRDSLLHALAAIALAAVAELMRLVRSGRGARWHGGAAAMPVFEHDVDLDRRVAAAVQNLAPDNGGDGGHVQGPFPNVGPLSGSAASAKALAAGRRRWNWRARHGYAFPLATR